MDELMRDGKTLANQRTICGVIYLDFIALNYMATVDVGLKEVVETIELNLESAQVTHEGLEADRYRERLIGDQNIVYGLMEVGLPVLELGAVQLVQRVRKKGRLLT